MKERIMAIIQAYTNVIKNIDSNALHNTDRAYGGIVRAGKGHLVESIAKSMIEIAWCDVLKQDCSRLKMDAKKMPIHIKDKFINNQNNQLVKDYLNNNKNKQIYKFGTDVHVYIDDKLVLPIECKAFTENAMLKRIIFDAMLMKEATGVNKYFLLQLESQLGGDYSQLNETTYGSPSTNTLLSYSSVDIEIITLLKGERDIKKPIHKIEYFKELEYKQVENAINSFSEYLKKSM